MSLQEGFELLKQEWTKEEKKSVVAVYDKEGDALKPCTNKRARILLERGHARILSYVPFTIQLVKDTGDVLDTEVVLHKGTVQVCVSSLGQNRIEFMLRNAIELSQKNRKVLFISTLVYESVLNELIGDIADGDIAFLECFQAFSLPKLDKNQLEEWIDQFNPDVVIVDNWLEEPGGERRLAKSKNIAFWIGLTTKQAKHQMPFMAHVRAFGPLEQDASLIIGLYGNQAKSLKNRFGANGKAANQENWKFSVE